MRPFEATLEATAALPDLRVLHRLAAAMGVDLGTPDAATVQAEIAALGSWTGERPAVPAVAAGVASAAGPGRAVLATWHQLLDDGRLQDGVDTLAGTHRPVVARLSASTASAAGASDGGQITVSTDRGSITLPVAVTEMVDDVVWLPTYSSGSHVHAALGAVSGSAVGVKAAG
jgi:NADH-quinone oxidoreductase subunit G